MKKYILIDTENVDNYNHLKSILSGDGTFEIFLFKSNNSKPVKAQYWNILFKENITLKALDVVGGGSQNMDIQMAGYIGYIMSLPQDGYRNPKKEIYVVSNDNHFNNLVNFLKKIEGNFEIKHIKCGN